MIPVVPPPEPEGFDVEVRKQGSAWLLEHADTPRPRPLWVPYLPQLEAGFRHLCGYAAMHIEEGTVDHYRSCSTHRALAYEWSNYRFASARMNSVKATADARVLDPFEVGEDWFEILLPSLQLVATERIPVADRARAAFTLRRLKLGDGEPVLRRRQRWYREFNEGGLSLKGLREHAPLVARAVDRRLARLDPAAFGGGRTAFERFLASEITLPGLKRSATIAFEAVEAALRGQP
ncbi:MAG TPA: hypothetical protein PK141_17705 [Polyangiaceae bacterium]|nr:hypothetical protein [Polyangiaceae bacterium]